MIRSDSLIKSDIKHKLESEAGLNSKNIIINVHNGIVTLSGSVSNFYEKSLAEKNVKTVAGVTGVVEELQVHLGESLKRSDEEIAQAAIRALEWNTLIPPHKIKVLVERGVITLSGEVEFWYQFDAAYKDVKYLYGVKNVINNIQIKPKVIITADQVSNKILSEFQRNAVLDARHVRVEVIGNKVILKGTVRSWLEYEEAQHAVWAIPGVADVESSQLKVSL